MTLDTFIPSPREEERLRWGTYTYRHWQTAYEQAHPAPVIVNVRFDHDPNWRSNRVWSIQAAHDRKGIWLPVSWLFYAALYITSGSGIAAIAFEIGIAPVAFVMFGIGIIKWKIKRDAFW